MAGTWRIEAQQFDPDDRYTTQCLAGIEDHHSSLSYGGAHASAAAVDRPGSGHPVPHRAPCWSLPAPVGPKITIFYRNLAGDEDVVTVDCHAISACLNRMINEVGSKYACVAECYRIAAAVVGMTPTRTQAVCWLAWRRAKGIVDTEEANCARLPGGGVIRMIVRRWGLRSQS